MSLVIWFSHFMSSRSPSTQCNLLVLSTYSSPLEDWDPWRLPSHGCPPGTVSPPCSPPIWTLSSAWVAHVGCGPSLRGPRKVGRASLLWESPRLTQQAFKLKWGVEQDSLPPAICLSSFSLPHFSTLEVWSTVSLDEWVLVLSPCNL